MTASHLADARLERRAPLRRVEAAGSRSRASTASRRAAARLQHFVHRGAAAGADQIVRVLALRQHRESEALARLQLRQRQIDRAIGGAPAGLVAVETAGSARRRSSRAARAGPRSARCRAARPCAAKARRHHGDHVDIALDHDQRRAVMRGLPGLGAVEEDRALVEERRLRRVEIFRRRVLVRARGRRTR